MEEEKKRGWGKENTNVKYKREKGKKRRTDGREKKYREKKRRI